MFKNIRTIEKLLTIFNYKSFVIKNSSDDDVNAEIDNLISKDNTSTSYQVEGSEATLIYALQDKLNMRFYIEEFDDTNNKWNVLIDAVKNGSFDFAMGGVTLTHQRMELVDFTSPIILIDYTILYAILEDPWMSLLNIIDPFNFSVWLTLFFCVILICCLFIISAKLINMGNNLNFHYFLSICLRHLVEQPIPLIKNIIISRITTLMLITLWLIVSLILTNSYKCKLTSSLITSKGKEFDGIDELVERDYNYFVNKDDASVVKEFLKTSNDPKFLETLNRIKNNIEFCQSILQTLDSKIAVIDEIMNIQYKIDVHCTEVKNSNILSRLRLTRNPLYLSAIAWPIQKNAPFRHSVNKMISQLHSGGFFVFWSRKYDKIASPVQKSHQNSPLTTVRYFKLINLFSPIIIWIVGLFIATIAFVIEIFGKKCI